MHEEMKRLPEGSKLQVKTISKYLCYAKVLQNIKRLADKIYKKSHEHKMFDETLKE